MAADGIREGGRWRCRGRRILRGGWRENWVGLVAAKTRRDQIKSEEEREGSPMEKMSPAGPRIPTPRQPSRGDDGGGFRGGGVPRWSEARSDGGAGENLGLAAFGFGRKMDDGSGHKPGSQPDSFYYFGDASTSSVKAQKRRWWWDLNPTAPSFLQPQSTTLQQL
jgi:hypothetical protein